MPMRDQSSRLRTRASQRVRLQKASAQDQGARRFRRVELPWLRGRHGTRESSIETAVEGAPIRVDWVCTAMTVPIS